MYNRKSKTKNKKQKTLASEEGILLSRPLLYKLNITEDNILTTLLTPMISWDI